MQTPFFFPSTLSCLYSGYNHSRTFVRDPLLHLSGLKTCHGNLQVLLPELKGTSPVSLFICTLAVLHVQAHQLQSSSRTHQGDLAVGLPFSSEGERACLWVRTLKCFVDVLLVVKGSRLMQLLQELTFRWKRMRSQPPKGSEEPSGWGGCSNSQRLTHTDGDGLSGP